MNSRYPLPSLYWKDRDIVLRNVFKAIWLFDPRITWLSSVFLRSVAFNCICILHSLIGFLLKACITWLHSYQKTHSMTPIEMHAGNCNFIRWFHDRHAFWGGFIISWQIQWFDSMFTKRFYGMSPLVANVNFFEASLYMNSTIAQWLIIFWLCFHKTNAWNDYQSITLRFHDHVILFWLCFNKNECMNKLKLIPLSL